VPNKQINSSPEWKGVTFDFLRIILQSAIAKISTFNQKLNTFSLATFNNIAPTAGRDFYCMHAIVIFEIFISFFLIVFFKMFPWVAFVIFSFDFICKMFCILFLIYNKNKKYL